MVKVFTGIGLGGEIMENQNKYTEEELYNIAVDSFKQVHSFSYRLLHRALKRVSKRLPEDCVIYLLMFEIDMLHRENKE